MDKVEKLADALYNQKVLDGWKNVSMEDCKRKADEYFRVHELAKSINL